MIKPVALIAEDELLIRMMAVEAFVDAGFIVLQAEHAAEAQSIHGSEPHIDLLFTDVNMPGDLNGIDLAEILLDVNPTLRVIITSALPIFRPIDHLPATFVSKPYSPAAVSDAALTLLQA